MMTYGGTVKASEVVTKLGDLIKEYGDQDVFISFAPDKALAIGGLSMFVPDDGSSPFFSIVPRGVMDEVTKSLGRQQNEVAQ